MELGRDFAFTARAKMNYAYFSRLSSKKLWNCGTTVVEISFSFSPSIMWHSPLFLLLLLLLFWRQRRRRKIATHSFQNGSSCALKWILTVLDTERVKNNFISVTYFVGNPRECFGGGGGGGGNIRCAPALFHLRWENRLVFFSFLCRGNCLERRKGWKGAFFWQRRRRRPRRRRRRRWWW